MPNVKVRFKNVVNDLPRHPTKKYNTRSIETVDMIVVHTTDWNTTVNKLAEYDVTPYFIIAGKKVYNHISKTGCPGITYHDVIMGDGMLYHCENYNKTTWHAGKWNPRSVAVALMYQTTNKNGPDHRPLPTAIKRLEQHLVSMCLVLKVLPKNIKGHRELEDTGWKWIRVGDTGKAVKSQLKWCPGQFVDLDLIRWAVTRKLQRRLFRAGYYNGAIDGIFGKKSIEALYAWRPKKG